MTWHPFQEWTTTRFAKREERRDGKTVYRMESVPADSHKWWLRMKPLWGRDERGNICSICSMMADHPNHERNLCD